MAILDFALPANFADGDKLRKTVQNAGFADADVYVANGRVIVANVPADSGATIGPLITAHVPDVHVPPIPIEDQFAQVLTLLQAKGTLTPGDVQRVKGGK